MSQVSMRKGLRSLILRDVKGAARQGTGGLQAVIFFAVVITLVPFGLGPDTDLLNRIAPGMIWIALVLSSLLTLDRLFQVDFEDGTFDLLTLSPIPLEVIVLAKCLSHWLTNALPLLLVTPLLGILLNIDLSALGMVLVTLVIGTPALTFIGAIGAALTVGVRRGGLLIALLIMPLYVPVVIFAVGAVNSARLNIANGEGLIFTEPNLLFLAALSLFGLAIGPLAAAAGLRLNLS